MKQIAILILGLLTCTALIVLTYQRYPHIKTKVVALHGIRTITEQRKAIGKAEVNGETIEVEVEVPITYNVPFHDTEEIELLPSFSDWLRFCILLAASVWLFSYIVGILIHFLYNKFTGRPASADTRDTAKRIEGLVSFCLGLVVGLFANFDPSEAHSIPPSQIVEHPHSQVVEQVDPALPRE